MKYYILALFVLILDQLTKWIIVTKTTLHQKIPVIENLLYITSHRNKGAAFGILQGQMWLFFIVTVIVVAFVAYYINKHAHESKLLGISLGLVLGGAIGNFVDRLFRGEVVDFIDVYIFTYDFAIFNVADMALVIGVGVLMLQIFLEEGKTREKK
ncbi:signal peptidase II [Anaerobacillus isosaccharinicus]|uniref:Lipoprotein signal peptidase n=1 Tax=Anaerobacillus isosaccharinicus TaxID=1532552 RepID=A0A1S2M9R5_9BACI|nr:signal peptidase II [Anaerobacillus isosaccharinicus]MBA5587417.1 signal peptidase II [Anaerobacillus isosaccharinicus]QOY34394.1 signal peptidase II [Anaerobacillus isosaccharinicus]